AARARGARYVHGAQRTQRVRRAPARVRVAVVACGSGELGEWGRGRGRSRGRSGGGMSGVSGTNERDWHLDDAVCADLVLGLLAAGARERAVRHAERCTPCAARLRAHVSAALRARADTPGAVLAIPRPQRVRRRVLALVGGAAATLACVVLLWPRSRPQ